MGKFTIKSGSYISITITDYMKNMQNIGKAFQELIAYPCINPEGYCLEWYLSETDMRCMVELLN
ncbi:MAG: hypothetical protein SGJ10_08475 [Bacteroidota bacterium]|nr:hypothetical protein [Bacteroidota bacterium]